MSTTTTSAYRIVPAPKHADMIEHDCALCEYERLRRPVFLAGPAGIIAAGSGCAAVALYGRKDSRTVRLVITEADRVALVELQAAEQRAERSARYGRAVEAFAADDDASTDLISARRCYWSYVRHEWNGEHRIGFGAFLEGVAQTGELPA